jgi:hypothetical protein
MGDQDPTRDKGKEKAAADEEAEIAADMVTGEGAMRRQLGAWDGNNRAGASGEGSGAGVSSRNLKPTSLLIPCPGSEALANCNCSLASLQGTPARTPHASSTCPTGRTTSLRRPPGSRRFSFSPWVLFNKFPLHLQTTIRSGPTSSA